MATTLEPPRYTNMGPAPNLHWDSLSSDDYGTWNPHQRSRENHSSRPYFCNVTAWIFAAGLVAHYVTSILALLDSSGSEARAMCSTSYIWEFLCVGLCMYWLQPVLFVDQILSQKFLDLGPRFTDFLCMMFGILVVATIPAIGAVWGYVELFRDDCDSDTNDESLSSTTLYKMAFVHWIIHLMTIVVQVVWMQLAQGCKGGRCEMEDPLMFLLLCCCLNKEIGR
ncbi:hypothetical protein CYMTET_25441 [Cymbomonas tetramitiformis]|uniref:Uncharacterized protein n=1 Tax=Cymbomonas tetramitiformis TaxID=36881 RepID=A0AAE0KYX3_9CHLO|nr:hypothetical protein CYMTET_25441 [Cymbomonas tetramitiformis]